MGDDVGRREKKCPGDAHGIGKVSWQPAGCHGDGMTVRQPGKQGCWLPRTTAQLGGQTKNFLCRLADEGRGGAFVAVVFFFVLELTRRGTKPNRMSCDQHHGGGKRRGAVGRTRGVWVAPSGGEISVFWLEGVEELQGEGEEGGGGGRKVNLYCSSDSSSLQLR